MTLEETITSAVDDLLTRLGDLLQTAQTQSQDATAPTDSVIAEAIEGATARVEEAIRALKEEISMGLRGLAARIGETTARVIELSDHTQSVHRELVSEIKLMEVGRLNLNEAVRRLEEDIDTLTLTPKP